MRGPPGRAAARARTPWSTTRASAAHDRPVRGPGPRTRRRSPTPFPAAPARAARSRGRVARATAASRRDRAAMRRARPWPLRRRGRRPGGAARQLPLRSRARLRQSPCEPGRGLRQLHEQASPLRVGLVDELERLAVVILRPGDVELERPVSRQRQEAPRGTAKLVNVTGITRGPGELEGLNVVVREHLGAITDALAGHTFDPLGGGAVLARPRCSRDLRVRDVSDEGVPERVFGLILHRRVACRPDELPLREVVQPLLDLGRLPSAHDGDCTRPEHLADDGRVVEQGPCAPARACRAVRRSDACTVSGTAITYVGRDSSRLDLVRSRMPWSVSMRTNSSA